MRLTIKYRWMDNHGGKKLPQNENPSLGAIGGSKLDYYTISIKV